MTSVLDRPLLYRLSCETTPEQVVGDYHNPLRVHDKNAILKGNCHDNAHVRS